MKAGRKGGRWQLAEDARLRVSRTRTCPRWKIAFVRKGRDAPLQIDDLMMILQKN